MNKLKMIFSGVAIVSVIGSAFALKSAKRASEVIYYSTTSQQSCPLQLTSATRTQTPDFIANLYATTNSTGNCLQLRPIYETAD